MQQELPEIPALAVPYGQDSPGFPGLERVLNENPSNKLLLRIHRIRVAKEPYVG